MCELSTDRTQQTRGDSRNVSASPRDLNLLETQQYMQSIHPWPRISTENSRDVGLWRLKIWWPTRANPFKNFSGSCGPTVNYLFDKADGVYLALMHWEGWGLRCKPISWIKWIARIRAVTLSSAALHLGFYLSPDVCWDEWAREDLTASLGFNKDWSQVALLSPLHDILYVSILRVERPPDRLYLESFFLYYSISTMYLSSSVRLQWDSRWISFRVYCNLDAI